MSSQAKVLDVPALETWLWDAACKIRGPLDAPKFKDYILPLIFLKRLSDVFEDELAHLAARLGDAKKAAKLVEADHKVVRFYLPEIARWPAVAKRTAGVGEYLTDVMREVARQNPALNGVINTIDFNATAAGQRIIDDGPLVELVKVLSAHRLGVDDVEPDILGRAYEYLIRKFAEGQGQSAGEFYTPREVAILIARLIDPEPGLEIYDPCCGSGGLLIKSHLRLLETHGKRENGRLTLPNDIAPLRLYGQEINAATFAMARMNAFIHEMDAQIAVGDTMRGPAFTDADGKLRRFDLVVANPMWNQDFPAEVYETDSYSRFQRGVPPSSSADWGWIQHMHASLKDGGRMAVVLDTGAVSRGSGNQGSNRERDARKQFVDQDLIEAVILLPDNLFYNTPSPGNVVLVNRAKHRPGEILLVNASKLCSKGRPKNFLAEEHVAEIADIYHAWTPRDGLAAKISKDEVARNDYNLSPSRYIALNGNEDTLPLDEAIILLREAEEERATADQKLNSMLLELGLRGLRDA
jgi:type I restriction enzyme M protein